MILGLTLVYLAFYLLPTIVALFCRNKNTLGVFLLNLLLGWTFIAWVIALVWAVKK